LNEASISDYLVLRVNHTHNATLFKSINRLPAAHKLLFQNGNLRIEPYWSPEPRTPIQFKKPRDTIDEFSHLLCTAVNDRLLTHTIGTDLNGGMDSTSVTALAHDLLTKAGQPFNLHAYTLGSNGLLDDLESPLAAEMAQSRNIEHHLYTPDKNRLTPDYIEAHLISPELGFMRRSNNQVTKLEHIRRYR
jgi:asparagine synthase (glutamine-hydrolysing)